MSRIATVFLVLVAAGLVVFVATTQRWRFSTERGIQPGSPLFSFDPDEIRSIQVRNGDQSFRLNRKPDGWVINYGKEDIAAPESVSAIINSALQTPVLDRIDSKEIRGDKNLASFGVLKSSLQLDFKGDRVPDLLFGKANADGARQYVSFEKSNTVYLIPSDLARLITLPVASFRDKRLAVFDPERIRGITIRKGDTLLELENTATGWRILKPLDTRANEAAIADLLKKLQLLRLESFDSQSLVGSASETRSLTTAEISLLSEGEETPSVIKLSPADPEGNISAHLEPRNITVRVPSSTADLLQIDLNTLRDRSLARLNPDTVDLIRINTPDGIREITRTAEGWSTTAATVDALFDVLEETKVTAFKPATPAELESSGLVSPTRRLDFVAVLSENTPEALAGNHPVLTLDIGSIQHDGTLPVHIKGSPEISFVPSSFLDALSLE